MTDAKEKIFQRLKVYLKHDAIGMTKDQYLRMMEQTGEEIDWDRCPADIEDFPHSVHTAMNIYNSMGNRLGSDIGYMGKDWTNLELLLEIYKIDKGIEREWCIDVLLFLDGETIRDSQQRMKAEHDKLRKK